MLPRVQQHPDLLLPRGDPRKRGATTGACEALLSVIPDCTGTPQCQILVRFNCRRLTVQVDAWSARLYPEVHF